jgi:hypothetical protein
LDQKDIWICCFPPCHLHCHWRDFLYQFSFKRYHGRKFLGKYTSGQYFSLTNLSSGHHWIML